MLDMRNVKRKTKHYFVNEKIYDVNIYATGLFNYCNYCTSSDYILTTHAIHKSGHINMKSIKNKMESK